MRPNCYAVLFGLLRGERTRQCDGQTFLLMNFRRLNPAFFLLATAGFAMAATSTVPRIPLKDFFDNPKISSAAISPDGKRLAFLAPEAYASKRLGLRCRNGREFGEGNHP